MRSALNILIIFCLLSFPKILLGQVNCCTNTGIIKEFNLSGECKLAHEPPLPFNYKPEVGRMIKFAVEGGPAGSAFFAKANNPSNRVLFVFHDCWGLNNYMKREAEKWQALLDNTDVYAIDLYDGKNVLNRDSAFLYSDSINYDRAVKIIKGLINHVGKDKKIATIGWCVGGGWAFEATLLAGENAVGCVMYNANTERDLKKIKQLKADVIYVAGARDKYIKHIDIEALKSRVTGLGYQFQIVKYDATHGFANPTNPRYDRTGGQYATEFVNAFLKKNLGIQK